MNTETTKAVEITATIESEILDAILEMSRRSETVEDRKSWLKVAIEQDRKMGRPAK